MWTTALRGRRGRATAGVAAAGLAALLLAGCSMPQQAGAAAVVGDARFTDSQLGDQLDKVTAVAPPGTEAVQPGALIQLWVQNQLVSIGAAREGLSVSEGAVATQYNSIVASVGGEAELPAVAAAQGIPVDWLPDLLRRDLQLQALSDKLAPNATDSAAVQEYLTTLSTDVGTEVSPRFGTWDPSKLTVGGVPDDLSTPLALAPASAQPTPSATP